MCSFPDVACYYPPNYRRVILQFHQLTCSLESQWDRTAQLEEPPGGTQPAQHSFFFSVFSLPTLSSFPLFYGMEEPLTKSIDWNTNAIPCILA